MGLVARALEAAGIASTLTSWNPGRTRPTLPPRATFTKLNRGATLGRPHDVEQQLRVLRATLALLEQDAPQDYMRLDESAE
ncbi:MAG: hypothetical protein D6712_03890 [Chloroflexi bacterium]|nr:MAG: hypothetical protein D6712_03890 [Chloroflexota bacterium]